MLAVDTSTLVAFLEKAVGKDIELFTKHLLAKEICLPPAVISEVISNPSNNASLTQLFSDIQELSLHDGFWQRAGALRQRILKNGLKANLADTLIAQSCIDHGVALITRDTDFRHFAKHGGLKLAI